MTTKTKKQIAATLLSALIGYLLWRIFIRKRFDNA